MRKTTERLKAELAAATASDDALAGKLQAMLSFLDKAGRDRIERDDALHAALAQDQQHFLGEIKVMRDDITAVITELRGTPQVTEQQSSNVTKLKAGE